MQSPKKSRKDNKEPVVSVVVPIYNTEIYLVRCIESIRRQTYKNLEIILVDDGSTDGSLQICNKYAAIDDRIKVIHQENGGLVSARKTGIKAAKGDFASHVDSDDWIESDMYEVLIHHMLLHDADFVSSGLYRDYDKLSIEEFDYISEGVYDLKHIRNEILPVFMNTGKSFKAGINMHLFNKLYKRELVLKHQMEINDCIKIGEDAALVYPCVMDAQKIVIIHRCFYHYCIRKNSVMSTGYQKELLGYQTIYSLIECKIIEKCKEQKEMIAAQLNYLMLYLLLLKEPQTVIRAEKDSLFPFENINVQEKVVLYGAGKFGSSLHRYMKENHFCEIILWIDKTEDIERGVKKVSELQNLSENVFDKVIIAVIEGTAADKIYDELIENGIDKRKIARINTKNVDGDMLKRILKVV